MTTFIGRKPELSQLIRGLEALAAKHGSVFCVVGDPGIGKTRLAEELASEATSTDTRVAWGRVWEVGGAPAFWPWFQVIRECAKDLPTGQLEESLPASARRIFGLEFQGSSDFAEIDAVDKHDGALARLPALTNAISGAERFGLFDSVARFFRAVVSAKPLLIILDDIHAADADSLLLLRFLARELMHSGVMIVATYRKLEPPMPPDSIRLLTSLARDSSVIQLAGLNQHEVTAFVESNASALPSEDLTTALFETTEGNPFFLDETLRLLNADQKTRRGSLNQTLIIPESVRDAVRRRLEPLSSDAREILNVAAVLGREFDTQVLSAISGNELRRCLELLEGCALLGIVAQVDPIAGRFRFSHAMTREALVVGLPKLRLMQTHLDIAHALERSQPTAQTSLAEIAEHYARSLPLGPWNKAVELARRGARRALQHLAYEEAARLYQLALDAAATSPEANLETSCEIFIELGEVFAKISKPELAAETYARAANVARSINRQDLLARAALGIGIPYGTVGPAVPRLINLLEEARAELGSENQDLAAMITARLAAVLYWSRDPQRGVELSAQAVELARSINDPAALIYTLWMQHYALWSPDNLDERIAIADELIDRTETAGMKYWAFRSRQMALANSLERGQLRQFETIRDSYEELQFQLGISDSLLEVSAAMFAIMKGAFTDAERLATEAFEAGQRRDDPSAMLTYAAQIAMVRFEQGRLGELESMLTAYAEQYPMLDVLRCGIALACVQGGREAAARTQFEYLARDDFAALRRDWNWLGTMAVVAEVCVFLADRPRAARIYELLKPYADRSIMVGWSEVCYGAVTRYLGMLATLLERNDDAENHFKSALEMHNRMGARPLFAHTQYQYAIMLTRRNRAGDHDLALQLVNEALHASNLLGMNSLGNSIRQLNRKLSDPNASHAEAEIDLLHSEKLDGMRTVVTALFVDLVESTKTAVRLGDRKWREQLSKYYELVRKHLADYGGREISNPGDGFLAVFDNPRRAIGAACRIRDTVRESNMAVRAGLHTGECDWIGGQVSGIAIHIGARVGSAAAPNEVLVSSTVRDLVAGSNLRMTDTGPHVLKGVPEEWHLYRVEESI